MSDRRLWALSAGLALCIAGGSGCATKGFVRTEVGKEVGNLRTRVDSVEGTASEASRTAQASGQRASQAALAAQIAQDLALGNVRREEVRRTTVYFDFDSAELRDEARSELQSVLDDLRAHPNYMVVLLGYTDASGDEEYNNGLAQRRAATVNRVLATELGTDFVRVAYVGLGEIQPAADNDSSEGRKRNRRTEVVVVRPIPATGSAEAPPTAAR